MSSQPRSVGRRLLWVITTTILLLLILALLAAITGGGAFGLAELNRSLSNLQSQIDANEQNLAALQSTIDAEFETAAPRQQQETLDVLQADVSQLQSDLTLDLDTQEQRLAQLERALATAVSNANTTEASIGDGLLVLQDDLNETNSRIDDLGGQIDAVQSDLEAASVNVSTLETAVTENQLSPDTLQETIALFRIWELIARARLRLLENNFGLAASDIEQALYTADFLIETREAAEQDTNDLSIVQTRLALALSNLPDTPSQAISDLEFAWNRVDQMLLLIAFPDENTAVLFSAPEEDTTSGTATPTPTPTPDEG